MESVNAAVVPRRIQEKRKPCSIVPEKILTALADCEGLTATVMYS